MISAAVAVPGRRPGSSVCSALYLVWDALLVNCMAAINKWQTITSTQITAGLLVELSQFCSEFLVHAADVEGLCQGIDQVTTLAGSNSVYI